MKLHEQVKVKRAVVEAYEEGIRDLERYLHSEKFHVDNSVNVNDVLLRLADMKMNAWDAEMGIEK